MQEEIWKDVVGYDNYKVSNLGRVKSLKFGKERILKPSTDGRNYNNIYIYKNGKRKTFKLHQLVAIVFLDHTPNGYKIVVDHIDGNTINNSADNLQLISHRENCSKDRKGYSSEYIGVFWSNSYSKWQAKIQINGKSKHLGYFKCELAAAKAYQDKLKEYNGKEG